MSFKKTIFILAVGSVCGISNVFAASNYQIVDLGTFGGATKAYALNDLGQVVGESSGKAFIYSGGALLDLGTLGGTSAVAYGINNGGVVVGASNVASGASHAFSWNSVQQDLGTLTIGTPPSTVSFLSSAALDVNTSGKAVGSSSRSFPDPFTNSTMVAFDGGAVTRPPFSSGGVLYAINDSGVMVGTDNGHGLLFSGTGFVSIPGGSDARDISNSGLVVGDATTATSSSRHAISYDPNSSVLTDLGTLTGGMSSRANALNELGQVVGWSASSTGNRAFLYESGAMLDLNSVIEPTSGWVLYEASDINESGQIVGWGMFNGQTRAFLITPVPEASTYGMMLAGLGLLGVATRRRKHAKV
jgi:probable HAF family extracellular repeat protein